MKGYKKGSLLEEYFLNPHFKPTPVEKKKLKAVTFPRIVESFVID